MPLPLALIPAAAGLISSGTGLLESKRNRVLQEKVNARNQAHDWKMYNQTRQDALDDWHRQNAYNSPEQQMQRLKEAGLNPNLVYGKGADNTAAQVRASSSGTTNSVAPKVNYGSVGKGFFDFAMLKQQQAQTDNLYQQNALLRKEQLLKEAQIISETVKGKSSQFLYEISLEARQSILDKIINDSRAAGFDADIKKLDWQNRDNRQLIDNELYRNPETREKILLAEFNKLQLPTQERERMEQVIQSGKYDNRLKEFEIMLNSAGMSKSDAMYYRLFYQLIKKYL